MWFIHIREHGEVQQQQAGWLFFRIYILSSIRLVTVLCKTSIFIRLPLRSAGIQTVVTD